MSILFENDNCFFISHEKYIADVYKCTRMNGKIGSYVLNEDLFNIRKPYKKADSNKNDTFNADGDVLHTKTKYNDFIKKIAHILIQKDVKDNSIALDRAAMIYGSCTAELYKNSFGGNNFDYSSVHNINDNSYLFPRNSLFYNHNVSDMRKHITDELYDVILLDPPWWNKYIRRKRKKSNDSYDMMYNADLRKLPIAKLLNQNGIVVVWCTNSQQHNKALDDMMRSWNVNAVSRWYWLKVTVSGEPICGFSKPPGKQPFERIVIGCDVKSGRVEQLERSDGRVVVSVPSALHSHKPPLVDLLKPFLPDNPKCLEIFARYLLPGWTSYGLEAIKFQHITAYTEL